MEQNVNTCAAIGVLIVKVHLCALAVYLVAMAPRVNFCVPKVVLTYYVTQFQANIPADISMDINKTGWGVIHALLTARDARTLHIVQAVILAAMILIVRTRARHIVKTKIVRKTLVYALMLVYMATI